MDILLIGGTGFVGSAVRTVLRERAHTVTVVARNPSPQPDGVRTVAGDVTEPTSIRSAFEGIDVVVNLVALSPLFSTPTGLTHDAVHRGGTETVVTLAEEHGVDRLVQLSALGADPTGETAYIRAKGRAEQLVSEADIETVIVRPSVVFGEDGEFLSFTRLLTTPYVSFLPGGGHTRFQPIWIGDLAPMLAAAVEEPSHAGEVYELGGPEQLTLAAITNLLYDRVVVLPVPMPLARIGLTIAEYLPFVPMGIDQYRSLSFDNVVESNDVTAFGVAPSALRSLSSFVRAESA